MMHAIELLQREIANLENHLAILYQEGRDKEVRFAERQLVDLREEVMFFIGHKRWPARKVGGSFQHTGTVLSEFTTLAGQPRLVLEFDAPVQGMLHVYRPDQVERLNP
jgi:hypothetical protein